MMIEMSSNQLLFSFPEVHPEALLQIDFRRTLRIPDDGRTYPLPPGLGAFPLRHVDDFASTVPAPWLEHGGVMLPMYQAEAMWISFNSTYIRDHGTEYPFAVKIAAGKIDAVSGKKWSKKLHSTPQDYVVASEQPWLDGFNVEKGYIRQFVAMPLGKGYTAEEQIVGAAETGGLQILVYPMKRKVFDERFPKSRGRSQGHGCRSASICPMLPDMGLAPGGRMRQEIYEDPYDLKDWDQNGSRCFVHLANSIAWQAITGSVPPTVPPSAKQYTKAGLPWFEYYSDNLALKGVQQLKKLKSVSELATEKGETVLTDNKSPMPEVVIQLRQGLKKNQVREGAF